MNRTAAVAETAAVGAGLSRPSRLAVEWGVVQALLRRDLLRLRRETSRWLGVVLQPLLFWALLGAGLSRSFSLPGAEGVDYLAFSFPGILVMVVLFTTVFATMAVIEDRREGFLQQVLVGPGSRASLVFGKTLGVTAVALVQALLSLLAAPLAGHDLLAVHWPMVLAALVLGSVGLTGASFAMAWVIGSSQGYHAVMALVLLPLWMVSGALFPPPGGWMDALMAADPMTWMVDSLRHGLHGGAAPVARFGAGTSLALLAAFALAAFLLAARIARRPAR